MLPDLSLYQALLSEAKQLPFNQELAEKITRAIDLTRLQENDSMDAIVQLCNDAKNSPIPVAAVCVYPRYVDTVLLHLKDTPIKIASVCNFPEGNQPRAAIINEIDLALTAGADEIDIVLPYVTELADNRTESLHILQDAKKMIGNKKLKVIVESGLMPEQRDLYAIAIDIIHTGADFLKTSTGKRAIGATHDAALTLLLAILDMKQKGHDCGFKASGGIRSYQQAASFLFLADSLFGPAWSTPAHFRIGTSTLFCPA